MIFVLWLNMCEWSERKFQGVVGRNVKNATAIAGSKHICPKFTRVSTGDQISFIGLKRLYTVNIRGSGWGRMTSE